METEGKKLYSVNSAAAALDMSRTSLYALMKVGALRYVLVGSDRRIPAEEIDRLAREGAPAMKAAA